MEEPFAADAVEAVVLLLFHSLIIAFLRSLYPLKTAQKYYNSFIYLFDPVILNN